MTVNFFSGGSKKDDYFNQIKISILSPEKIRSFSYGEVKNLIL